MSEEKGCKLTPIERLALRLRGLKGRVVKVYLQIDKDGQPAVIAVQEVGKVEKATNNLVEFRA